MHCLQFTCWTSRYLEDARHHVSAGWSGYHCKIVYFFLILNEFLIAVFFKENRPACEDILLHWMSFSSKFWFSSLWPPLSLGLWHINLTLPDRENTLKIRIAIKSFKWAFVCLVFVLYPCIMYVTSIRWFIYSVCSSMCMCVCAKQEVGGETVKNIPHKSKKEREIETGRSLRMTYWHVEGTVGNTDDEWPQHAFPRAAWHSDISHLTSLLQTQHSVLLQSSHYCWDF